jgi:hypothetical protein
LNHSQKAALEKMDSMDGVRIAYEMPADNGGVLVKIKKFVGIA